MCLMERSFSMWRAFNQWREWKGVGESESESDETPPYAGRKHALFLLARMKKWRAFDLWREYKGAEESEQESKDFPPDESGFYAAWEQAVMEQSEQTSSLLLSKEERESAKQRMERDLMSREHIHMVEYLKDLMSVRNFEPMEQEPRGPTLRMMSKGGGVEQKGEKERAWAFFFEWGERGGRDPSTSHDLR